MAGTAQTVQKLPETNNALNHRRCIDDKGFPALHQGRLQPAFLSSMMLHTNASWPLFPSTPVKAIRCMERDADGFLAQ
jgi:hypothetical protein